MSVVLIVFAVLVGMGLLVLAASLFARWRTAKARRAQDDIVTATEVRIINGQADGGPVHLTVNPTGRAARSPPSSSSKSFDSAERQNAIGISLLETPRESDVRTLQELGFGRESALAALRQNGNDVQRAASFLTSS